MQETPNRLSAALFERLQRFDTPTIFNARVKHEGAANLDYTDHTIRALLPELGLVVGYAVTVEVTTNDEVSPERDWFEHYEAINQSADPLILVIKDVDSHPGRGASFGDGMAAIHKRLGVVAAITDGTVRDLDGIREVGLPVFGWGAVPGHGRFVITRRNAPVTVGGLRVAPGDLVMADSNGAITVPTNAIEPLLDAAQGIQQMEAAGRDFASSPEFTFARLVERSGWTKPQA
jgi:regulator of RNase E activity RraA